MADMLQGLPSIITLLLDNGHALQALPVIALLEWLAQHVTGQPAATVAVRLQRCQALTQLGLLAEAATVMQTLMQASTCLLLPVTDLKVPCCLEAPKDA